MPKRDRRRNAQPEPAAAGVRPPPQPSLPKGGIDRLQLGASFAEYDPALADPQTYVHTPAYAAAQDFASGKFFFVGRRGTGKTALRRYCATASEHTSVIIPEIFSPSSTLVDLTLFDNSSKKPFRSLVSAFRRALQAELLVAWRGNHPTYVGLPPELEAELAAFGDLDFDSRALQFIARSSRPLARGDDQGLINESKAVKSVGSALKGLGRAGQGEYTLLIDSIDDYWEGSDASLVYLTAFMHACLEVSTQLPWARTMLFLRENIFERVRARDSESSRIETAVVGMEWTTAQLLELVERRLNRPFNTKFALGGPTWNAWFERPDEARSQIFTQSQRRPRDVLIYATYAIEQAQGNKHSQILIEDLQAGRRRFSDNRFKDLGDEYAENYPQLAVALSRFYGLGRRFTIGGMESFVRKLHADQEVVKLCAPWIYEQTASIETFARMLYNIGFIGIQRVGSEPRFRGLGPQDTSPPPVSDAVDLVIHQCYWDALDLQDALVRTVPEDSELGRIGLISDLPGGLDPEAYVEQLTELAHRLQTLPRGHEHAAEFEAIVGDVIRLCFFRALENVEQRVRDVDGRVIRDWVASNRAQSGFWELIRVRYNATQVIWECKNYDDLKSDDFHQASYYLNEAGGRFLVLVSRGKDTSPATFQHVRRVLNDRRGLVLPLTERDLLTFIRQARNGKIKEDHIQERYDHVIRRVG